MARPADAIERGLVLFQELLGENPALEQEFAESLKGFVQGPSPDPPTARRHLEWFLLERPSATLGGVPADVLRDSWLERAEDDERDHADAFLGSVAGAFEITSCDPERGLWVRDLFGLGEYPIEEADAAQELEVGDLLVGRLFPVGEGIFVLSPAVGCFRNPRLIQAVRGDLERMRASRRGVLRIQQVELERLFFGPPAEPLDPVAERERARAELLAAGLTAERAQQAVERVSKATSDTVVTEVLNDLAFHTEADLERARRALVELWATERASRTAGSATAPGSAPARAESARHETVDAQTALDAFDRGRAEGRDLDQLFRELADDLGVELEVDNEDAISPTPDFPGVVGAMVEEFLWDVGRERGEVAVDRLAVLRRLSRWGTHLGVFENLGSRDLLEFAGRWLLDEGELSGPDEALEVLDALEEFCRWCEDRHAHPLWRDFGDQLERLRSSVPRLVQARHTLGRGPSAGRAFRVVAADAERLVLRDEAGDEVRARLPEDAADLIQPGDMVHALAGPAGTVRLGRLYPGELYELLDRGDG